MLALEHRKFSVLNQCFMGHNHSLRPDKLGIAEMRIFKYQLLKRHSCTFAWSFQCESTEQVQETQFFFYQNTRNIYSSLYIWSFFKFLLLFNYNCMSFLPIPPPHPSRTHLPPPPPPSPLVLSMCPL